MAGARPFISTAAGGVVDMVDGPALRTANGCSWHANGILAEPKGEAFADALIELQKRNELAAAMGERARQFASVRYSKETLIAGIDSLYRELSRSKVLEDATREHAPMCFDK
jgi:glycosyltransferase involved in cell wall biosynthesis